MPILEALSRRYTVRVYDEGRPVPRELVACLLEAAVLAPSAHNRQPWRWVVVTAAETKRRLAERMAADWERDLGTLDVAPETAKAWLDFSRRRFTTAPVLIVAALSMEEMDVYPDERRNAMERTMGIQSVAAALENLLLAAAGLGLGACWCSAALFAPEAVREVLEIPERWEPQALVTAGYPRKPDARRPHRDRLPLDRVVRWV